jgi:hypothetical protein
MTFIHWLIFGVLVIQACVQVYQAVVIDRLRAQVRTLQRDTHPYEEANEQRNDSRDPVHRSGNAHDFVRFRHTIARRP